jgi:hypothetical protein
VITSELIAQHTEEFLAAGGVIQIIPFLHTTWPNNWSVLEYRRVHNKGWVLGGVGGFSDARSDAYQDGIDFTSFGGE